MDTGLRCLKCGAEGVRAIGAGQYRCSQCNTLLGLFGAGVVKCPRCQNAVLNEAAFCHMCGAALQRLAVLNPCQACGQQVPRGSLFCPYCGTAIAQPGPAESAYTWSDSSAPLSGRYRESDGCPSCGRTIGPTAEVCPYCGVNVEAFIMSVRQQTLSKLEQYERVEQEQRQRESVLWQKQEAKARAIWRLILPIGGVSLLMISGFALVYTIARLSAGEADLVSLLLTAPLVLLLIMSIGSLMLLRRFSPRK
ncbi:MAG: zinc ribbon domain-containing protein [Thermoflexales bacterium]|nr:zinc ribbon domain-containing protein [Thermoflexales bacterium]